MWGPLLPESRNVAVVSMVAVWLSGNIVEQINGVALRRAGLVLRWGDRSRVHRHGI